MSIYGKKVHEWMKPFHHIVTLLNCNIVIFQLHTVKICYYMTKMGFGNFKYVKGPTVVVDLIDLNF